MFHDYQAAAALFFLSFFFLSLLLFPLSPESWLVMRKRSRKKRKRSSIGEEEGRRREKKRWLTYLRALLLISSCSLFARTWTYFFFELPSCPSCCCCQLAINLYSTSWWREKLSCNWLRLAGTVIGSECCCKNQIIKCLFRCHLAGKEYHFVDTSLEKIRAIYLVGLKVESFVALSSIPAWLREL